MTDDKNNKRAAVLSAILIAAAQTVYRYSIVSEKRVLSNVRIKEVFYEIESTFFSS